MDNYTMLSDFADAQVKTRNKLGYLVDNKTIIDDSEDTHSLVITALESNLEDEKIIKLINLGASVDKV